VKPANRTLGARLRVVLAPGAALGPGRADLLEGIRATGSISAAARRMGMSWTRAWSLVEALNRDFGAPLIAAAKGGRRGGTTRLTPLGEEALARYRRMEKAAQRVVAADLAALRRALGRTRSRR
jgi:molybdate transport system regulatory protein